MSLINDALRKARRQTANQRQSAGPGGPTGGRRPPHARKVDMRVVLAIAGGIVLVLSAALLAWWAGGISQTPQEETVVAVVSDIEGGDPALIDETSSEMAGNQAGDPALVERGAAASPRGEAGQSTRRPPTSGVGSTGGERTRPGGRRQNPVDEGDASFIEPLPNASPEGRVSERRSAPRPQQPRRTEPPAPPVRETSPAPVAQPQPEPSPTPRPVRASHQKVVLEATIKGQKYTLDYIVVRPGDPYAVFNGRDYHLGMSLGDFEVVSIENHRVVLQKGDSTITVRTR